MCRRGKVRSCPFPRRRCWDTPPQGQDTLPQGVLAHFFTCFSLCPAVTFSGRPVRATRSKMAAPPTPAGWVSLSGLIFPGLHRHLMFSSPQLKCQLPEGRAVVPSPLGPWPLAQDLLHSRCPICVTGQGRLTGAGFGGRKSAGGELTVNHSSLCSFDNAYQAPPCVGCCSGHWEGEPVRPRPCPPGGNIPAGKTSDVRASASMEKGTTWAVVGVGQERQGAGCRWPPGLARSPHQLGQHAPLTDGKTEAQRGRCSPGALKLLRAGPQAGRRPPASQPALATSRSSQNRTQGQQTGLPLLCPQPVKAGQKQDNAGVTLG